MSEVPYVSRDEFEAFERNVGKAFDNLDSRFAAMDRKGDARASELDRKLDALSNRGTDWKAIWSGLSVLCAALFSVGGVIAWGLLSKIDAADSRAMENRELVMRHIESEGHPSLITATTSATRGLEMLGQKVSNLERDLSLRTDGRWRREDHDHWVEAYLMPFGQKTEAELRNLAERLVRLEAKAGGG